MAYIIRWMFLPSKMVWLIYRSLRTAYLKSQFKNFGKGSSMAWNVDVIWPRHIDIGENVSIGKNVSLWASSEGQITIGDGCAIAAGARFVTPTHDYNVLPISSIGINKSINVGKDVWIGTGAIVLPGVTIHEGAVVAAAAVVTKNVPPNCVVGGVPAQVIKKLEPRSKRLERGRKL